ncbi:squalene epoxidase 1 [Artemisia annua]|uniref:Squalene monooxygenase n=1 Tax=Artemisia annua TaxID=35608 RepID=A0A2U1PIZ2_ARTAN|nr:squalene epoxidase 1 [Artemisia annua]
MCGPKCGSKYFEVDGLQKGMKCKYEHLFDPCAWLFVGAVGDDIKEAYVHLGMVELFTRTEFGTTNSHVEVTEGKHTNQLLTMQKNGALNQKMMMRDCLMLKLKARLTLIRSRTLNPIGVIAQRLKVTTESTSSGRSFHNGDFIQRMQEKAATLPNVKLEQGTVTFLLQDKGTIGGAQHKTKSGEVVKPFTPLTVL